MTKKGKPPNRPQRESKPTPCSLKSRYLNNSNIIRTPGKKPEAGSPVHFYFYTTNKKKRIERLGIVKEITANGILIQPTHSVSEGLFLKNKINPALIPPSNVTTIRFEGNEPYF